MTDKSRIDELEMRLAHQDVALSELNDVVLSQWRKIEALERQMGRLNEEIQNIGPANVPVDKPPHY